MKITYIMGPFLPVPPLAGGAVERCSYAFCLEYARMGHDVTMISRRYPGLPDEETERGVRHIRLPSTNAPKRKLLYRALDLLFSIRARSAMPRSDVAVTNSPSLPLLLSRKRAAVIYVNIGRFPKGQYRFYRRVDRLQPPSNSVARAIAEQSPAVRKLIRVVPNALSNSFSAAVSRSRGEREKTVLYIGRIAREKGIELLIKAFGDVRRVHADWSLRIVGPWETHMGGDGAAFYEELRALAVERDAAAEFTGPVFDEPELIATYRSAEIFVYPSVAEHGEAFGVAPLEAMACGCATIVSGLGCFEDFLEHDANGLVFDHRDQSGRALASTLCELMESPHKRQRLASNGIATAERFRPARIARLFTDDFEALLAANRGRQA